MDRQRIVTLAISRNDRKDEPKADSRCPSGACSPGTRRLSHDRESALLPFTTTTCRDVADRRRANLVSMTRLAKAPGPKGGRRGKRPEATRPGRWRLQDAKARFSELVRRARIDGPQHVTVHGREEVVVIGADAFQRLTGDRTGRELVEAMQASPHRSTSLDVTRMRLPVRDVEL
jgi:prevent-host-death family protein